ncbi:MAG TPA: DNA-processing protein DprA [Acidimicrobiales bacterium]|nr:DNA-processing protein DprA [Acidimicrobiales bacterium]
MSEAGPAPGLPPAAYAVALAALAGCGQGRLRALLATAPAGEVWADLRAGRLLGRPGLGAALGPGAAGLVERWRQQAASVDPAAGWRALVAAGVEVWVEGGPGYPAALVPDPAPPPLLFRQGDVAALDRPAVAIVGTRRCTGYGLDVARELGRDLAAVGITVVSGLALGIDGAAHEGALAAGGAPPVAVVGSGLDVVYPRRHARLWRRVREAGLLLSEAPLGAAPEAWRFPLRNRVIAALARVVVVVESHAAGGSLSTVQAALERDVPVMAVPGSVRSPSSVGTNRLLADGVAPVVDAQDVITALALQGVAVARPRAGGPGTGPGGAAGPADAAGGPDPGDDPVLHAVDWAPTATEDILRRTGAALGQVSTALTRLEMAGLVRSHGGWWERVAQGGRGR